MKMKKTKSVLRREALQNDESPKTNSALKLELAETFGELLNSDKKVAKLERHIKRLNKKLDKADKIIEKLLQKKNSKS
jgi:predicted RNase H-like nuclease (RuvC/YqgF family)|tara:strand:- start:62 stop:295 length:234 start_codon:yes stop_codon:yes gene_type:complete